MGQNGHRYAKISQNKGRNHEAHCIKCSKTEHNTTCNEPEGKKLQTQKFKTLDWQNAPLAWSSKLVQSGQKTLTALKSWGELEHAKKNWKKGPINFSKKRECRKNIHPCITQAQKKIPYSIQSWEIWEGGRELRIKLLRLVNEIKYLTNKQSFLLNLISSTTKLK